MRRTWSTILAAALLAITLPAAAQADSTRERVVPKGAYTRTQVLTWTTFGFGALHHTDHALRGNHSGFPFTREVTPFTASLLVYPLALGGLYFDAGPLYWIILNGAAFAGTVATHIAVEPPSHIYDPWSDGSNRLGVRSSAVGGLALGVAAGVTLGLSATLTSHLIDGVNYGWTWKRRPVGAPLPRTSELAFGVTPDRQLIVTGVW